MRAGSSANDGGNLIVNVAFLEGAGEIGTAIMAARQLQLAAVNACLWPNIACAISAALMRGAWRRPRAAMKISRRNAYNMAAVRHVPTHRRRLRLGRARPASLRLCCCVIMALLRHAALFDVGFCPHAKAAARHRAASPRRGAASRDGESKIV